MWIYIENESNCINLDHVSTITYSNTPEPRVTIHIAVPHPSDSSGGTVALQGAEAAKLIDDLAKMQFISAGLSGEAARQERERREQEQQKMAAPARNPSKVRIERAPEVDRQRQER